MNVDRGKWKVEMKAEGDQLASGVLSLAHSPDPDDVFMWWPLGSESHSPAIDTEGLRFACFAEDIQVLNRRAMERADVDITAISMHAYPHIRDRYRLTACAGSYGEGYGPKLIARTSAEALGAPVEAWVRRDGTVIAVPGVNTTAFLTLRLLVGGEFKWRAMPFHEIPGAVARGEVSAGVVIHDAQLTYRALGLHELADLGAWWNKRTGLPLPLGGNAVRRDMDVRLGAGASARIGRVLQRAVRHAVGHWEEGLGRIAPLTIGLDRPTLERYLHMYVNARTIDCGPEGRRAIETLLGEGHRAGLCPDPGAIDLL